LPSSILECTGVAQPGRGTGLRNQLMRVRLPPPVPKNFELRISDFEMRPVAKFAIRDSKFAIPDAFARVAKLVKALVCKTGHREFNSHRVLLMRRWSRNQARLAHNQQIIR
jgi:hypothetical protein